MIVTGITARTDATKARAHMLCVRILSGHVGLAFAMPLMFRLRRIADAKVNRHA